MGASSLNRINRRIQIDEARLIDLDQAAPRTVQIDNDEGQNHDQCGKDVRTPARRGVPLPQPHNEKIQRPLEAIRCDD